MPPSNAQGGTESRRDPVLACLVLGVDETLEGAPEVGDEGVRIGQVICQVAAALFGERSSIGDERLGPHADRAARLVGPGDGTRSRRHRVRSRGIPVAAASLAPVSGASTRSAPPPASSTSRTW